MHVQLSTRAFPVHQNHKQIDTNYLVTEALVKSDEIFHLLSSHKSARLGERRAGFKAEYSRDLQGGLLIHSQQIGPRATRSREGIGRRTLSLTLDVRQQQRDPTTRRAASSPEKLSRRSEKAGVFRRGFITFR